MNYVKKLPANGNFVVSLDLRGTPIGPGVAVVASAAADVIAAADRTVPPDTAAAALWRRHNGFSELMALRVPWLVVFPSELAKQATPEHGAWLRYRTSDEGVGVGLHLMVAMKSLKQRAPQLFAHVALLPIAASFSSFSARGFIQGAATHGGKLAHANGLPATSLPLMTHHISTITATIVGRRALVFERPTVSGAIWLATRGPQRWRLRQRQLWQSAHHASLQVPSTWLGSRQTRQRACLLLVSWRR